MRGTVARGMTWTILVIPVVAILLTRMLWAGETPEPLPTHWSWGGEVNGTTPGGAFFLGAVLLCLVLAAAGVAGTVARARARADFWAAISAFGAWVIGAGYVEILYTARGAARADDVTNPWWVAVIVIGLGVSAFGAVRVLMPDDGSGHAREPRPSGMHVGSSEKVVWIGSARSRIISGLALVLALGAAVAAVVLSWGAGLALLVAAIACGWAHAVTVVVDDRGVHTMWGPLGWPRTTTALDAITSAHDETIEPGQWGGWGYRISKHGHAAVVRRGPGLVVQRRNRPTYAVTVDHADDAADTVNALLSRARA